MGSLKEENTIAKRFQIIFPNNNDIKQYFNLNLEFFQI